jgi:hypothetical protein
MAILRNMAAMTTATAGTGTMTLVAAITSFLDFQTAGVPAGATVTYLIVEATNREVGRGVWAQGAKTLTRATVLKSTNAGSQVTLAGAAQVYIADSAEDHIAVDETQPTAFTSTQKRQVQANTQIRDTVANLNVLSPIEGDEAFATNGCKLGEATSAGTGVKVYYSQSAWRTLSNDATVSA